MRLAHRFAMESEVITADAIEATEFPELAEHYSVSAVPTTVINGTTPICGVLPEEAFVDQILRNVSAVPESDLVSTLGRHPRRKRDTGE